MTATVMPASNKRPEGSAVLTLQFSRISTTSLAISSEWAMCSAADEGRALVRGEASAERIFATTSRLALKRRRRASKQRLKYSAMKIAAPATAQERRPEAGWRLARLARDMANCTINRDSFRFRGHARTAKAPGK